MTEIKYIPALKYKWLTSFYDIVVSVLMPEKKFKSAILINANIAENNKVLDFGVGTATLSIMAYTMNRNAEYAGIDVDENILAIAKSKILKSRAEIKLIKYNGAKLPFEDNSFDKVISSLVIHHLTDDQKIQTFRELKRVLNINGEMHIADWGYPKNIIQRILFHTVQLLDGYTTTAANVKGKLPYLFSISGFKNVEITHNFCTILGTIQVFKVMN